jgi:hypothetical protein
MANWVTPICVLLWFCVLAIGLNVNSQSIEIGPWWSYILFVLSSTITNVGILSMLASLIGNGGDWVTALRRGFTLYVAVISGAAVVFTSSVAEPTVEQYGKLAGMVSLICLFFAYHPDEYESFLKRLAMVFRSERSS